MIERIPNLPDNVLGFMASGAVSGGDFTTVVVPAIEAASNASEALRLLYVIPDGCTGFSAEAMWDNTKVVMGHVNQLEKVALVSDQGWLRDSVGFLADLVPGEIRAFPMEEEEAAGAWVAT